MTKRQNYRILTFNFTRTDGNFFWGFFMGGGSFADLNIFKYNILTFRLYNLVIQYGTDTETGKAHE